MATTRRDILLNIQAKAQAKWAAQQPFQADAPASPEGVKKYFVTFPYPYMNGYLHLGHAFSLSKCEFAVGYQRLKNKVCLFPFGFHCTGMPIQACANKLKAEIEKFGNPPKFPGANLAALVNNNNENGNQISSTKKAPPTGIPKKLQGAAAADPHKRQQDSTATAAAPEAPEVAHAGPALQKFQSKKTKSIAKLGTAKYQWEILQQSGVDPSILAEFAEPVKWLEYFPKEGVKDLMSLGLRVDWRRSFITTDVNPYYNSFIQWQFRALKKLNKIQYGKRYTIYSPMDKQACADHDRASGEGVQPQLYTLIKLKVTADPLPQPLASLQGKQVFLPAATLRPETMAGQTNCWVLPDGDYIAIEVLTFQKDHSKLDQPPVTDANKQVFILSQRAALNLSYQGYTEEWGSYKTLCNVKGSDLIGLPLFSPSAINEVLYVLPLLTVSLSKGTGIVTSVPSDAPDDYRGLQDLKEKPKLREKFNLKDEWVLPFDPVPIIEVPDYGTLAAVVACQQFKVQSQNDTVALANAKAEVYKKGFYGGKMIVGKYAGRPVEEVKNLIKNELIQEQSAIPYSEPEKIVMSRSGDECVVALLDQWYLNYGEPDWLNAAKECLAKMETYAPDTRKAFELVLEWLHEWACSRSFGLGTRLPWDEQYVIESLSDSTIYMAYYTVAHLLQGSIDNMDGHTTGPLGIKPENLTDDVWDCVLLGKDMSDTALEQSGLSKETIDKLAKEFEFWYPLDLRVSGRDLINNHLTFFIYNHVALFQQTKWPLSVRTNGFMMINAEKMSKSTGNFMTLREGIEKYSSDGIRFALADAGDGVEDANFTTKTADDAVLKLTTLITFVDEGLAVLDQMRTGPVESFYERVFDTQINKCIKLTDAAYEKMMFREAIKIGFYEMVENLGQYRVAMDADKQHTLQNMHRGLFLKYCEVQTIMLSPICPHTAECIWEKLSAVHGRDESDSVMNARWPEMQDVDEALLKSAVYLSDLKYRIRIAMQPKKKGKEPAPTFTKMLLFICEEATAWQKMVVDTLKEGYDESKQEFHPDADKKIFQSIPKDLPKSIVKKIMPFAGKIRDEVRASGPSNFDLTLGYNEMEVLQTNMDLLKFQLGLEEITIVTTKEASAEYDNFTIDSTPSKPSFILT